MPTLATSEGLKNASASDSSRIRPEASIRNRLGESMVCPKR